MVKYNSNLVFCLLLFQVEFLNKTFTQVRTDSIAYKLTAIAARCYQECKFDSCEYFLHESLQADSNYCISYYWLGLLEFNFYNDEAKSEEYFIKALEDYESGEDLYAYLGTIYLNQFNYNKAEKYFTKNLEFENGHVVSQLLLIDVYLKSDRKKDAQNLIDRILNEEPLSIRKLINIALVYQKNKYFKEAEQLYKKVISLDSTNAFAYYKLGGLYSNKDRVVAADESFQKAISLDTNYIISYFSSFIEEEIVYKKANSIKVKHASAFFKLAWLYIIKDYYINAELSYHKAIELDSNSALAFNNLGWLYILLGKNQAAEANLKRAHALDSNLVNPITLLAWLQYRKKNYAEAEAGFIKALKLNPAFSPALFGRAYVLSALGQSKEAFNFIEEAIQEKLPIRQLRTLERFESLNGVCLLHALQGLTLEMLQHDEELVSLRESSKWEELIRKYFPVNTEFK
jgi:tetratricopeptide (TPR) repeat protein